MDYAVHWMIFIRSSDRMKVLNQEALIKWCSETGNGLATKKPSREKRSSSSAVTISTDGMDGLTAFDLGRTMAGTLASGELVVSILERGPFTEKEEGELFDNYLNGTCGTTMTGVGNGVLFEESEISGLVIVLSLCILFRWDFWLVRGDGQVGIFHSHDVGLRIYSSPSRCLDALGFKS